MFFPNFERVCEELRNEHEPKAEIKRQPKIPKRTIFNELYELREEMEWQASKD